jgi:hypothetical protein
MDYLRIYKEFIQDRKLKQDVLINNGFYFEKHHIVPKSKGGTDDKDNIIFLSASDHYFAHLLLAKHYKTRKDWYAVAAMLLPCPYHKRNFEARAWIDNAIANGVRQPWKWTTVTIREEANKYDQLSDLKANSSGAYNALKKHPELWAEIRSYYNDNRVKKTGKSGVARREPYWTEDKIMKAVEKCKDMSTFSKVFPGAYNAAKRLGLSESIYKILGTKVKWTKDLVLNAASECETFSEFCKRFPGAHKQARYQYYLDEVKAICPARFVYATKESIRDIALAFKTKGEFESKATKSYNTALRNGWLDFVCAHMTPVYEEWTHEKVKQISAQFEYKAHFKKAYSGAYKYAKKHNLLDELFAPGAKSVTTMT